MLTVIILQVRSFSAMFMVVLTAPLGLAGVVLTLLVFHQPFGFNAILGCPELVSWVKTPERPGHLRISTFAPILKRPLTGKRRLPNQLQSEPIS
jgi:hypothetical protein